MIRTFTRLLLASSALVPIVLVPMSVQAQELPTGGSVVGGSAVIGAPNPGSLSIHQGSDRAIINWQSFSIGEGGRVDVYQPGANSVLLNRVTGATTSRIAGALKANGQVFVVNPNGILITSTGSVNAGGFVASTLNITDDRFMMGNILMSGQGGEVRNEGTINIVRGGYAALIGGSVDNSGLIAVPLGRVGLGAGSQATLDLNGDGFLQVALPAAGEGGVAMSGRISADGGAVLLTAAIAVDAARRTVNLSGVIEARGVEGRNGSVVLTGPNIQLSGASIDVSGPTGGGTVKIGGDHKGAEGLQRASILTVDAASTIRADATESGKGGDVVLWSDRTTRFDGLISARGAGVGSGGNAEVSSAGVLHYTGVADLRGATFGTLLLDPYNVVISNGAGSGGFTPSQNDSVINTTTLQNALALANVTIATGGSGSPGAQVGDITIASALTWASGSTLTLNAFHGIFVNAAVTITGAGGLALGYDATSAANLKFGAGGRIDFGATDNNARLSINGAAYRLIYSLADLQAINNDADLKLNLALATSMDAAGIDWNPLGVDANGDGLNNDNGLMGVFTGLGNTISNLAIDRSFNRVGLFGLSSGTVRDIGLVGGTVKGGGGSVGALVGTNYGAVVNAFASSAVSGSDYSIGGLVGENMGSIEGSYATGAVSGGDGVGMLGGLVGSNADKATIKNSYATGRVSGGNGVYGLGGLVGYNDGIIDQAYATGAVSGLDTAGALGGLTGSNSATGVITNADAKGAVTGGAGAYNLGGLTGENYGSIATGTASGTVTGGDEAAGLGGLVGQNIGSISGSTATGAVSAGNDSIRLGGLAGSNEDSGSITLSHATGAVTGLNGVQSLGGLVGYNSGAISDSDAKGLLRIGNGGQNVGGLVGLNDDLGTIRNSKAFGAVSAGTDLYAGGGLVGWNGSLISGSYAYGGITALTNAQYVGGLAGFNTTGGSITGSHVQNDPAKPLPAIEVKVGNDGKWVGGLVGSNQGVISNSDTTARVTGALRLISAGGFAGSNDGAVASITNSQATGAVTGGANSSGLGGLVGTTFNGAITGSTASGAVTGGAGSESLGGLVGENAGGSITASSAAGAVSGGLRYLGGLVGRNSSNGSITASSASGVVSTTAVQAQNIGGLVGSNDSGTIKDSFTTATASVTTTNMSQWVGGLVGSNNGVISGSSAAGNVTATATGSSRIGGLVGNNFGAITESSASGVIRGVQMTGGLVGYNTNAAITNSHATGAVSGTNYVGGLVGNNDGGVITLSTATLGAITGGQYVGGLVGSNSGAAARITSSRATGKVTGGANSSYVGGLVGINDGLAGISDSTATGDVSGGGTSGLYIGGLVGGNRSGAILNSTANGNVTATAGTNNVGGLAGGHLAGSISGSEATGSVTVGNNAMTVGGFVGAMPGTNTTITNSKASGAVTIGNAVTNTGGFVGNMVSGSISGSTASGAVNAGNNASNLGGFIGVNNGVITGSFANGSVTAGLTAQGVAGFAGFNGQSGSITGSNATGAVTAGLLAATGATGPSSVAGFVGLNRGKVTDASSTGAVRVGDFATSVGGFVGYNNDGAIKGGASAGSVTAGLTALNIGGFVGNQNTPGSITGSKATGDVTAGLAATTDSNAARNMGGFAGNSYGTITDASATGAVRGGPNANSLGGFIGYNLGTLTRVYATGRVSGGANSVAIGGLIGTTSSANSVVKQSYSTGLVTAGVGSGGVGGLVGTHQGGSLSQVFSTGAVYGGLNVGGLVGGLAGGATITEAFATGFVSSAGAAGGLVGRDIGGGAISNSYWDTQTTGQATTASGGAGQTTAQLQGVLPTLFKTADWGTGTGLYPYLKAFFPNGVQVISGTAYKADGLVMASNPNGAINVSVASAGGVAGSASTGANGYFYIFAAPGTWSDASGVAVFTQADAVTGSQAGVSYRAGTPNAVLNAGMDLTGGWRRDYAGAVGSLTGLDAGYATAIGTTAPQAFVLNSRQIDASGAFAIDRDIALSNDGALWLSGAGPVSQIGGSVITAPKLLLSGPGQFTLTGANVIGELAVNGGQVNLFSTSGLTISDGIKNANGVAFAGVSTSGGLRLATAGNLTLAAGGKVSGVDPTLATNGAFINNQGSDAVTATSGRWLIYAARPTGNVFGGLDSGNTAIWNTSALGGVSASGNRYVFAYQPTLTVTTGDLTKTYGEDATARLAGLYTVTGFEAGVAGAYRGDTAASILSGAASVASAGAVGTANVAGSPYAITATTGTLAAADGYALSFANTGRLTVNQRALTVTADALSRIYGEANPTLTYTVGGLGLVNGDSLSGALATTADSRSNIGTYAITQGSLGASGNYAINFQAANLTVLQRALTVTADALSRIYGEANPTLTYTVGGLGLVNGDSLSGALATTADVRSNVGTYAITQGSLGASGNYAINFQGANLTVLQRALTVTADALSRTYGEANPALTYTVGGLGLVNGDSLSGALATTANVRSNVGAYAITQGTLGNANYAVTYQGANLTLGQRALTLTADALSRIYGEANPTLTYRVGGLGLVNGDSLSGALATTADVRSNVGTYAITQGSLGASSNYAVTFQGALLSVGQRSLVLSADALSRAYGVANPPLTYRVGGLGLVNGDVLSGVLATSATVASNPGAYAITQGTLAASANYAVTYQGADLTVQRPVVPAGYWAGTQLRDALINQMSPKSELSTLEYSVDDQGVVIATTHVDHKDTSKP